MNDTGQIQQVFIFILFIFVAGFVVLLGYKAISGMSSDSCEAEKIQFKEKIVNMINNYDSFNSVHNEEVKLPCGFHIICFVDANVDPSWVSDNTLLNANQQKIVSTAAQTNQNIFVVGEFAEPAGYSDKLAVANDELCVEARGNNALLRFRGQGRTTLVEEWQYVP